MEAAAYGPARQQMLVQVTPEPGLVTQTPVGLQKQPGCFEQSLPQQPQFVASIAGSTHSPSQQMWRVPTIVVQSLPQAPQFRSLLSSDAFGTGRPSQHA
jgi:hypothetical protein